MRENTVFGSFPKQKEEFHDLIKSLRYPYLGVDGLRLHDFRSLLSLRRDLSRYPDLLLNAPASGLWTGNDIKTDFIVFCPLK